MPRDDAEWDSQDALAITNAGEVSYTIYLRANALYSFACQEANQEKYHLYPFDNQDVIIGGTTEKGAYFGDVYASFTDSYVLDKTNRQGWYGYDNFLYYFVDNEPLTGIQMLPSYEDPNVMCFYEFAEDGTCSGTVSGMLEYEGNLYFPMLGIPKTGWQTVKTGSVISYYYFDPATGAALDGEQTIGGYTYLFEDRILVKGQIVTNETGSRYMWAGEFITQAWVEVDGKLYYAKQNAYFMTGMQYQYGPDGAWTWFAFGDDGHVLTEIDGIYDYEGERYLVQKGIVNPYPGLVLIDGYYYYFGSSGKAVRNREYWVTKTNDLLPQAMYHFDEMGRMTNPPQSVKYYNIKWVNEDGTVLETDLVEEGLIPTYDGAEPTKAPTATSTFVFTGWDPEVVAAQADATYTAVFAAVRNNPFSDVDQKGHAAFFDAIMWAVENGITTGTGDGTTFSPSGECQRAQVVTFLWRAAGKPAPTSSVNPFTDVAETDFFYEAVLWAVEKGITNGLTETTFGPYELCNRAQVVTFLYRAMNKPAYTNSDSPFSDVEDSKAFYYDAVLWAVENKITNGMGDGTFGVDLICNRAQVVTFLYRTYVK